MKKKCMILLVDNNAGVLTRITSLFCQRGFNIDSLTVSSTDNPRISRITIVTHGEDRVFSQIIKQTDKLIETRMIFAVEPEFSMLRELLLLKLAAEDVAAEELERVVTAAGAKIIDRTRGTLVAEVTGTPEEIDGFLSAMAPYKTLEMCRSGAIAMEQGSVFYDL